MSPSRCSTTPCSASSPYSGTCTSVFTTTPGSTFPQSSRAASTHAHASHATGLEELLSPQIATLQLDNGEEAGDLVEEAEEDTAVAQLLHHTDHLVTRMDGSQVTDHRRVLLQQRTLVGTHERVLVRQHTHHTHTQLLPHREGLTWVLHRSQLAHVLRIQHSTDL